MALNKKFFESLGESLSKTAKDLSDKASNVYETQKVRSRITNEERTIEKLKTDIGNLTFSRYQNGEVYDGEQLRLCQEIEEHLNRISVLEKENANLRGRKICPSCRREVPIDALFCPSCGTACPNPESPVEKAAQEPDLSESEETIVEAPEEVFEEETRETEGTSEETFMEVQPAEEAFSEAEAEQAAETAAPVVEPENDTAYEMPSEEYPADDEEETFAKEEPANATQMAFFKEVEKVETEAENKTEDF